MKQHAHPRMIDRTDGQRGVVHVYGEPVAGDYAQIATVRFGAPLAVPGTDATITL